MTRSAIESNSSQGIRVAIRGNSSTKAATTFMAFENGSYTDTATAISDNDNIFVASGGDIMCMDYSDTSSPSGSNGNCSGLTISDNDSLLINSSGDLSISSTAELQSAMSSL